MESYGDDGGLLARYSSRLPTDDGFSAEERNAGNAEGKLKMITSSCTAAAANAAVSSSWGQSQIISSTAPVASSTAATGHGGQQQQPSSVDAKMEYSLEGDKAINNGNTSLSLPQLEEGGGGGGEGGEALLNHPAMVNPLATSRDEKREDKESSKHHKVKRDPDQRHQKRDREGNPKHEEEHPSNRKAAVEALDEEHLLSNNNNNNNNSNRSQEDEDNLEDGGKDKNAIVVQQRKRMCRQRAASQPIVSRSRFRSKEQPEGFHGKPDSSVTYKIGEGLPDISKLWKESASNPEGTTSSESVTAAAPTLEVRIAADLATTSNRQVRGSQLWGTDIYTDDSDLVAVLMHTGYYSPTTTPPPSCISEIKATIRILPPQTCYKSTLRNSVRSRAWGAASGCSYRIERCRIVKSGGGIVELEPCSNRVPVVAPTLAPAAMERMMTTRSTSSNTHRQQKYVQEVTIQYNLCNEPWMKYSMSIVADRGLKKSQYTSARLKKGDVLYLETHRHRYELAYDSEKSACNGASAAAAAAASTVATSGASSDKVKASSNGTCDKNGQSAEYVERYKWSRCNFPMPIAMVRAKGVPLPANCVQVLDDGLAWEEIQWSPTSVWIRGKEFVLARAQFLSSGVEVLCP